MRIVTTILLLAAFAHADDKVLRITPTDQPPTIDGKLDDACWQTCTLAGPYTTVGGEWMKAQTISHVTYDDEAFYLGIRCNEPAMANLKHKAQRRDANAVFADDNVELFFDTNHDKATFLHVVITPAGTLYDALCDYADEREGREESWSRPWPFKVARGTDHWTVEMKLPYAMLDADQPTPGTTWGLNLNRSRWAGADNEFGSWAGIIGGFNQPRQFGTVVFQQDGVLSYAVESIGGRKSNFNLALRFRNRTANDVKAQVNWSGGRTTISVPAGGEQGATVSARITDSAQTDIPVGAVGAQPMKLTLTAAGKTIGERRAGMIGGAEVTLDIERYYYPPDVKDVRIKLTNKTDVPGRFNVTVRHGDRVIATNRTDKDEITFDASGWPIGRFVVSADLESNDGRRLLSLHRVIHRRAIEPPRQPTAGAKLAVRDDGVFTLDGEPFFPYFPGPTPHDSPLAQNCFNVRYGDIALVEHALDRPKVGLPWVTREDGKTFVVLPDEKTMYAQMGRLLKSRRDDPSILCWMIKYEGQIPLYRGVKPNREKLDNVAEYRRINTFIKKHAPNHLTSIHVDAAHHLLDYQHLADVIELAHWRSSYARQLIPNLTDSLTEVRKLIGPSKPFLFWIGSSIPDPKYRTAEEIRCAVYLSMIHGASGVIFHMGHGGVSLDYTRHWSVYAGLAKEVEVLYPVIKAKPGNTKLYELQENAGLDS